MTLENLVKSWGILAPDEIVFKRDNLELFLLKNTEALRFASIHPDDYYPQKHADNIQGYLQRRILERNWIAELYFSLDRTNVSSSAKISIENSIRSSADIKRLGGQLYREYWSQSSHPSILEALLTAYVMALAMERPITPGKWTHFKKFISVDVLAQASFVEASSGKLVGTFVLEETLDNEASLFSLDDGTFQYTLPRTPGSSQTTGLNRGDRVFYLEADRKWTRKSRVFLDLVEDELRFVKTTEA